MSYSARKERDHALRFLAKQRRVWTKEMERYGCFSFVLGIRLKTETAKYVQTDVHWCGDASIGSDMKDHNMFGQPIEEIQHISEDTDHRTLYHPPPSDFEYEGSEFWINKDLSPTYRNIFELGDKARLLIKFAWWQEYKHTEYGKAKQPYKEVRRNPSLLFPWWTQQFPDIPFDCQVIGRRQYAERIVDYIHKRYVLKDPEVLFHDMGSNDSVYNSMMDHLLDHGLLQSEGLLPVEQVQPSPVMQPPVEQLMQVSQVEDPSPVEQVQPSPVMQPPVEQVQPPVMQVQPPGEQVQPPVEQVQVQPPGEQVQQPVEQDPMASRCSRHDVDILLTLVPQHDPIHHVLEQPVVLEMAYYQIEQHVSREQTYTAFHMDVTEAWRTWARQEGGENVWRMIAEKQISIHQDTIRNQRAAPPPKPPRKPRQPRATQPRATQPAIESVIQSPTPRASTRTRHVSKILKDTVVDKTTRRTIQKNTKNVARRQRRR